MDNHFGIESSVVWMGYVIRRKQDFSSGQRDTVGYVVTRNEVAIMPGATWFVTPDQAKKGIAAFVLAKKIMGDPGPNFKDPYSCDGPTFWCLMELTR